MGTFTDPFTDTSGTNLQSRVSPPYAWTKHPQSAAQNIQISNSNRARQENADGTSLYIMSGVTPASADYSVSATLVRISGDAYTGGVTGRCDATAATFYHARVNTGTSILQLYKSVAGTLTQLGSNVALSDLGSNGASVKLTLDMSGTTIRLLLADVEKISVTDSAVTAAGFAGLRSNTGTTDSTRVHFDDFTIVDSSSETPASTGGSNRMMTGVGA